ncbi:MAG: hypothetical protein DCC75_03660 [Proteobacteria bacterium]|nr:MAG: hypothetical protein DCC75_03660 [Pseudomonadota bacterium]
MKVKPRSDVPEIQPNITTAQPGLRRERAQESQTDNDAVRINPPGRSISEFVRGADAHDRAEVSQLSRMLRQELSPEAMAQERSEKVERIKKLIQSESYWQTVSSDQIASKLNEEISAEILLAPKESDDL